MNKEYIIKIYFVLLVLMLVQGCAGVNTFPTIARAGDTVSILVGGSEDARKETISATLTDANNNAWDLQALGLIRSVFNVRADGRSKGLYNSTFLDINTSWAFGHEPVQTVLVVDLPDGAAPSVGVVSISTNTSDNSSGFGGALAINIEIIPGTGSVDEFLFKHIISGDTAADFSRMEPLPHAKISFGAPGNILAAVSLVVDFDESIILPENLSIYVPQATVRDAASNTFDKTQRMVYWRQDGKQLFVDIIAPQGIDSGYLNLYVLHPNSIGVSAFSLLSAQVYDVNGGLLPLVPVLEYFP